MNKCTCIEQDGHRQGYPARPLRPGDYVRWDHFMVSKHVWIEGVLTHISREESFECPGRCPARIDVARSNWFALGSKIPVLYGKGITLRLVGCGMSDWNPKGRDAAYALTDTGGIEISGSVPWDDEIMKRQFKVSMGFSWRHLAIEDPSIRDGAYGLHSVCNACCRPIVEPSTPRCPHGLIYRASIFDQVPGPVLYDGLTAEQCLELYVERQREHDSSADCYLMTEPQLAAARELWSAQLRAKREAAKEKERCAVTYCEVDSED